MIEKHLLHASLVKSNHCSKPQLLSITPRSVDLCAMHVHVFVRFIGRSCLSEAKVFVASRDSGVQLLAQILVAFEFGQIELVEASVARLQFVLAGVVAVDVELGKAIHALQLLEPIEWDLAGTGDELQQLGALLFIEALDCPPEPLDLRGSTLVVVVLGVVLPVIHVNVRKTGDEEFELLLVEDGDEVRRHNVVETTKEGVKLRFDGLDQSVLYDQADVLPLIFFSDFDITTTRYQVDSLGHAECLNFRGEGLEGDIRDVIFEDPNKRAVIVKVERLHVLERDRFAQHTPVDSPAEVGIEQAALVERLAYHATNELEEGQMLIVDATELVRVECRPVGSHGIEQGVIGVEHLASHDSKPLARHTTCIDTFLAVEANVELAILDFVAALVVEIFVRVQEGVIATDSQLE